MTRSPNSSNPPGKRPVAKPQADDESTDMSMATRLAIAGGLTVGLLVIGGVGLLLLGGGTEEVAAPAPRLRRRRWIRRRHLTLRPLFKRRPRRRRVFPRRGGC